MLAYIGDFWLQTLVALACLPLILLIRRAKPA
jgi:hypothetical protein